VLGMLACDLENVPQRVGAPALGTALVVVPTLTADAPLGIITTTVRADVLNVRKVNADYALVVLPTLALGKGDVVICQTSESGWCTLVNTNGHKVWQGCLENSGEWECKEK